MYVYTKSSSERKKCEGDTTKEYKFPVNLFSTKEEIAKITLSSV